MGVVANPERRAEIADAALELLGEQGARAVTHRAVDAKAGLPAGTCANYFPTRERLLTGMAERVFARVEPDPVRLDQLAAVPLAEAEIAYVEYVLERLLARPVLARALIELRLEGARNPAVAEMLGRFLRQGFEADVDFHQGRGLPGGRSRVLMLRHLVDGMLLDALTLPLDSEVDLVAHARKAVESLS